MSNMYRNDNMTLCESISLALYTMIELPEKPQIPLEAIYNNY